MTEQLAQRLVLHVQTSAGEQYQGIVGFAEVQGASALLHGDFRREEPPPLSIGDTVQISLPGLYADETTTFRARAIKRTEDRARTSYHFEVGKAVAWVVSRFRDGRLAPRVQPFAQAPIRAAVQRIDGGTWFPTSVKDISTTGIGLYVPVAYEPALFSAWRVRFRITFPPERTPIELVGNVCSRRYPGNAVHYGIDFDSEATDAFGDKQDAIHEYVVRCQSAAMYLFRQGADSAKEELARLGQRITEELADEPPVLDEEELRPAADLGRLASVWGGLSDRVRDAILLLIEVDEPEHGAEDGDGSQG